MALYKILVHTEYSYTTMDSVVKYQQSAILPYLKREAKTSTVLYVWSSLSQGRREINRSTDGIKRRLYINGSPNRPLF